MLIIYLVINISPLKKAYSSFCNAIFKLQTPINGKKWKIALGNISWKKSYWHDC